VSGCDAHSVRNAPKAEVVRERVIANLGRIGIWRRHQEGTAALREIESLGYGALWLGGSPSTTDARRFLERSTSLTIATGILNVWQHQEARVAEQYADLERDFPGRFLLGIGVGHVESTAEYARPLGRMRDFFDGLDAASTPVPRERRMSAALGPKMLALAARRSLGAHTYFTAPAHTRRARELVGPEALVVPEVAVVVETDTETARRAARDYAAPYLGLRSYTRNLLRFGFTERDLVDGGSDRLIDAVVPHGSPKQIAEAVQTHFEAGADHVALQTLEHGVAPFADYQALAAELLTDDTV
jgi:probable F420-dependent oxidoreductase